METLQIAYKILHSLETGKKADYMGAIIGPKTLGVTEEKWLQVIQMLMDERYISGVEINKNVLGHTKVDIENIRITLSGAEYLSENSTMKKIGKTLTNVIEIIKP